jgi:tellurite resistance protein TehA-like permease
MRAVSKGVTRAAPPRAHIHLAWQYLVVLLSVFAMVAAAEQTRPADRAMIFLLVGLALLAVGCAFLEPKDCFTEHDGHGDDGATMRWGVVYGHGLLITLLPACSFLLLRLQATEVIEPGTALAWYAFACGVLAVSSVVARVLSCPWRQGPLGMVRQIPDHGTQL